MPMRPGASIEIRWSQLPKKIREECFRAWLKTLPPDDPRIIALNSKPSKNGAK